MRNKSGIFVVGCLGFIGLLVLIAIITAAVVWGQRGTAIALDEQIKSQHVANKSNYDNMWKRFKEMAQVTDMQADDIKRYIPTSLQAVTRIRRCFSKWYRSRIRK